MSKKRKTYDELEILIEEYQNTFNENFPFFLVQNKSDTELVHLIKTALKTKNKIEISDNDLLF